MTYKPGISHKGPDPTPQPSVQPRDQAGPSWAARSPGPITDRVALGLALKSAGFVVTDEHIDRALASLTANRWALRFQAAAPDPVATPPEDAPRTWREVAAKYRRFLELAADYPDAELDAIEAGAVASPAPLDVERLARALRSDPGIGEVVEDVDAFAADLGYRYAYLTGSPTEQPRTPHPEDYCGRCGGRNPSWHAASPLWNAVMRAGDRELFGIVCPNCFAELAAEQGVTDYICLTTHDANVPLALTFGDGRVWDRDKCMWVEAEAAAPDPVASPAPLDPAHLFRVPFDRDYVLLPDEADGWTDDQFDAFYEGLAAGIQVVKDRYESPELRAREARKLAAMGQPVAESPDAD